jgi:capsular exopolysaccharide synthesis family protein
MLDAKPPNEPLTLFNQQREQGTVRYLQAIRQHPLLIAFIVLVAVGASTLYSLTATKRYEASADVLVTPIAANDETFVGFSLLREGIEQARSVVTAARIVESPEIVAIVDEQLDLAGSDAFIDVEPLGQSNIVTITATAPDPELAAEIANAFADVLVADRTNQFQRELRERIRDLNSRLATIPDPQRDFEAVAIQQRLAGLNSLAGAQDPTLRTLSHAVPPGSATWPRPILSIVVALLGALLLGAGAAIALELANPRVSREDELLLTHRLPILARVPRISLRLLRKYQLRRAPLPASAQKAYRTLSANLATAGQDMKPPETIMVTSSQPGEGKTLTAVNLALALASAGRSVVLVDGDLHRPMVATMLGVTGHRDGFARLLTGTGQVGNALVPSPTHGDRLKLLLSSPEQAYLTRTLDTETAQSVLAQLKEHADVVVIDAPPLPEVAEAVALADAADVVLIAVRLGHTRRDRLDELRRMLALRGISPLGFVVTTRERYTQHADDYYYSSEVPAPTGANGNRGLAARRRAGAARARGRQRTR